MKPSVIKPSVVKIVALVLMSCGTLLSGCGGTDLASPEEAPPTVTGQITEIEEGPLTVASFVVEDESGTYEVFIASDVDYGFDLGHLFAHEEAGDPVAVELEVRDGRLIALSIEDA